MRILRSGIVEDVIERTNVHLMHAPNGREVWGPTILDNLDGGLIVLKDADVHRFPAHRLQDKIEEVKDRDRHLEESHGKRDELRLSSRAGGGPLLPSAPGDRVARIGSNEDEPTAGGRLCMLYLAAEICVHKQPQLAVPQWVSNIPSEGKIL